MVNDIGFEESIGVEALYEAFFEYTCYRRVNPDAVQNSSEEVSTFLAWLFKDEQVDDGWIEEEDDPIGDDLNPGRIDRQHQQGPLIQNQQEKREEVKTVRTYHDIHAGRQQVPLNHRFPEVSRTPPATFADSNDILEYANVHVFGNKSFRTKQREIIESCLHGKDVFVLMPTGGGKSLCYQLPAVISTGVTVVITPLLSLMQDQVQSLCGLQSGGVPATYISSQQTSKELNAVYAELEKEQPSMKLLFVTPEQFVTSDKLQNRLMALDKRGMLARLVVDECHCVSQWGHDFRPEYNRIGVVKQHSFPTLSITALTATATSSVQSDVIRSLKMRSPDRFKISFFRSNLIMRVIPKDYAQDSDWEMPAWEVRILHYVLERRHESGIVYCLSREDCEVMSCMLNNAAGVPSAHYHAGMTPGQRTAVQNKWRSGEIKVVAATIAFGMGIDHPHVRYVIHATISKSLEGYYQEAGRCGRDGGMGECILFYGKRDVPRILNLLRQGKRTKNFKNQLSLLNSVTEYCCNSSTCRHAQLLKYLGEEWDRNTCTNKCDVCRNEVLRLTSLEKRKKVLSVNNDTNSSSRIRSKSQYSGFTTALSLTNSRSKKQVSEGEDTNKLGIKTINQFAGFTSAFSLTKKS